MQIYLVGGAVRDELLNYPFHERDWLVVGATPEELNAQGFTPVGKDFPVFLHPKTKEEYALARTERKTGRGYAGFEFCTDPNVTIEDDLIRRDLTINAIAKSESGELVDPYNGAHDIETRTLRHVSQAFKEDPVRILRVARFCARYHHLGFTVHPSTITLMAEMVENGEVDHLVAERTWKEFEKALAEKNPEMFVQTLHNCGALKRIFPEISALFGIPQRPEYHPEIDCGIHALLSLKRACELSQNPAVRFASLVHDLGKAKTPKDSLPRHIGHEEKSLPLVKTLCERVKAPNEYRELALLAAKYHTHCHRAPELKASTILKTLEALDALRRPERVHAFLLCCQADAQGRTGFENTPYPQADIFRQALSAIQGVNASQLQQQGYTGKALGEAIRRERLNAIKKVIANKED